VLLLNVKGEKTKNMINLIMKVKNLT